MKTQTILIVLCVYTPLIWSYYLSITKKRKKCCDYSFTLTTVIYTWRNSKICQHITVDVPRMNVTRNFGYLCVFLITFMQRFRRKNINLGGKHFFSIGMNPLRFPLPQINAFIFINGNIVLRCEKKRENLTHRC